MLKASALKPLIFFKISYDGSDIPLSINYQQKNSIAVIVGDIKKDDALLINVF